MTAVAMVAVVVRSYLNICMLGGGICGFGNDCGVTIGFGGSSQN